MVARSELTAAMAAAKARGEEAQAKAELVEGLEAQLARLREQLRDAQASLSEAVPRTELSAALARLSEATAKLVAADQAAAEVRDKADKHQEAIGALKEALELKEAEAADLRDRIQVGTIFDQGFDRRGILRVLRQIELQRVDPGGPRARCVEEAELAARPRALC
jgi:predicted  nucleic acid-binding Zn-ribbon protein